MHLRSGAWSPLPAGKTERNASHGPRPCPHRPGTDPPHSGGPEDRLRDALRWSSVIGSRPPLPHGVTRQLSLGGPSSGTPCPRRGARRDPARSANNTEAKCPSCHKLQRWPVIADEPATAIATGALMTPTERRFSMVLVIDTGGSGMRAVTPGADRVARHSSSPAVIPTSCRSEYRSPHRRGDKTRTRLFGPGPMEADAQPQAKGEVYVLQLSRAACLPAASPWLSRKSTDHVLGYQAVLHPRHAYAQRSRRPCRDGRCGPGYCRRTASHRLGGNRSGRPEIGTGLFIPVLLGLQWHGSCRVRIPQRESCRRLGRPCRSLADIGENFSADRDGQSGPAPPRRVHGPHGIGQFAPHRPATRHGIRSRSSPRASGTWIPHIGPGRPPPQHELRADTPPGPSHGTGSGPADQAPIPSPAPRRPAGRRTRCTRSGRQDRSAASSARGIGASDCPMRSWPSSGPGVAIRSAPRFR